VSFIKFEVHMQTRGSPATEKGVRD